MKPLSISFVATAGAIALAATVTGCGSGTPGDPGATGSGGASSKTIVFATPSSQIEVINAEISLVKADLAKQGVNVIVQDAGLDPAKQAQQLEQSIDTGQIQGAWVFAVAPETLGPTVKLAQSKHIPLVIEAQPSDFGFNGPQPGITFNVADFSKYGSAIGNAAATCVDAHGGSAQVLYLSPPSTAAGSAAVKQSALAAFKAAAPKATVVADGQAADLQSAQTTAQQLLLAHPDVTAVIAGSDETALGAVAAAKAANKKLACVVDGGGGPDAAKAFQAGDITNLVAWDFSAGVTKAAQSMVKLLADPTAVGEQLSVPIKVSE